MLDDRTVMWDEASVAGVKLDTIGDYEVSGTAEGSSSQAKITVHVVADPNGGADPDPERRRIPSRSRYSVDWLD